jgi:DNA-binding NarL/FixJ family response regulator
VKTYARGIYRKLEVGGRTQAVLAGFRHGYLR